MAALHGPITVSANLQIRLPIKLVRDLGVQPGDEFYVSISEDDPDAMVLLPAAVVGRRYGAGTQDEHPRTDAGQDSEEPGPQARRTGRSRPGRHRAE